MTSEDIANTFIDYQNRFLGEATPKGINDALQDRFNAIPDELNISHRLVIVAGELDSSTERIVSYLREDYGVDINVVLFRAFQDGDRQYLTRAWLTDPFVFSAEASSLPASKGEWNGEFYVSFGEGDHRRWNDAKRYGFVSAGGGEWYVRTLRMLQPGNRIWVSVPGKGYVGVGEVKAPAVRYDEFTVYSNGSPISLTNIDVEAPNAFDERYGEHFVCVDWIKTVNLHEAVKERGFFGNQNTVAQPRSPKWHFTVERLEGPVGRRLTTHGRPAGGSEGHAYRDTGTGPLSLLQEPGKRGGRRRGANQALRIRRAALASRGDRQSLPGEPRSPARHDDAPRADGPGPR